MALLRTCLCWREVRSGCIATGIFSMTISFVQIILQVALWSGSVTPASAEVMIEYVPYALYIGLGGLDLVLIVFSIVLLFGIEKDHRGRALLLPWFILAVIYVLYEASVNIYFFAEMFPVFIDAYEDSQAAPSGVVTVIAVVDNSIAMVVTLVIYWALKMCIYIMGLVCVLSRYQELARRGRYGRHSLANSFDYPGGYFSSMSRHGAQGGYPGPPPHQAYPYEDDRPRKSYKGAPLPPHDPRRYHDTHTTTGKTYPTQGYEHRGDPRGDPRGYPTQGRFY